MKLLKSLLLMTMIYSIAGTAMENNLDLSDDNFWVPEEAYGHKNKPDEDRLSEPLPFESEILSGRHNEEGTKNPEIDGINKSRGEGLPYSIGSNPPKNNLK